jgi:hypothetical protein
MLSSINRIRKFYKTIKSQISSSKLQINLSASGGSIFNDQNIHPNGITSLRKPGESRLMPLGAMVDGSFVWIFEFGSLRFVWDLIVWCLEFS